MALGDIHRITLPLPFAILWINTYVIEGRDGLTLIDTGVRGGKSRRTLEKGFREKGLAIRDLRRILVTHAHADHCGQAADLASASGASVWAHEEEAELLGMSWGSMGSRRRVSGALWRWGVPSGLIVSTLVISPMERFIRRSVRVDRPLKDGEPLDLGGVPARILHVPGHSRGQMVVHLPDRGVLFSADHLLPDISPVPLLQFPEDQPRFLSLVRYNESLTKVEPLDLELVNPAHGEPFEDHRALIAKYRRLQEKRSGKILRALERGPRSPFDLGVEVFHGKARSQTILVLSEIIGHLDLLQREGLVRARRVGGRTFFERTEKLEEKPA